MNDKNTAVADQAIALVSMMVAADPRLADECIEALVFKGCTRAEAEAAMKAIIAAADALGA